LEIATYQVPYSSKTQKFHLYFLGDVHLGSAVCDEDELARWIYRIYYDPEAIVFLLGDLCEYITRKDWRWREKNVAAWVDIENVGHSQIEYVKNKLAPIVPKIFGAIQGNHELKLEDEFDQSVHKQLCQDLNIRDLGYMAMVRLHFKEESKTTKKSARNYSKLDIVLHHGWGGGRTDGADTSKLDDLLRDYDCDVAIAGHTHRYWAAKSVQHRLNHWDNFEARVRLKGRSGTFLRTVMPGKTNYSELQAMRPVVTGCLMVTYDPTARDFWAKI